MRTSTDEIRDGAVYNGYDYNLQVWVVDGIVENCGHPLNGTKGHGCCNARILRDRRIKMCQGYEVRQ